LTSAKGIQPVKGAEDISVEAGFHVAPKGYEPYLQQHGFHQLFVKVDDKTHIWSVNFSPTKDTLDDCIANSIITFEGKNPLGQVHELNLPPNFASHLNVAGTKFRAFCFRGSSYDPYSAGTISLFLKTGGGFWAVDWHSHNLATKASAISFQEGLDNFKIIPKQVIPKTTGASVKVDHSAKS